MHRAPSRGRATRAGPKPPASTGCSAVTSADMWPMFRNGPPSAAPPPMATTMSELLELDPELLLHALESLPAVDQARAAQSCKLLYILVHELNRSTSFMISALAPIERVLQVIRSLTPLTRSL